MAAKDILSTENIYKLVIGAFAWCGLYFGLKSDVRDNETANAKDHFFFNYRLSQIENRLDIKQSFITPGSDKKENNGPLVMNFHAAILPHELERQKRKFYFYAK